MVCGQEIRNAKTHVDDVTPLAELCKYSQMSVWRCRPQLQPQLRSVPQGHGNALVGKRCPLEKSHVAAHWLPTSTQEGEVWLEPSLCPITSSASWKRKAPRKTDFIYSMRIADSLVACVLVPTYELGKVIVACPHMKTRLAGCFFHIITSQFWPSSEAWRHGVQYSISI